MVSTWVYWGPQQLKIERWRKLNKKISTETNLNAEENWPNNSQHKPFANPNINTTDRLHDEDRVSTNREPENRKRRKFRELKNQKSIGRQNRVSEQEGREKGREIPWNKKKPCFANLLTTRPRWRPWLRGKQPCSKELNWRPGRTIDRNKRVSKQEGREKGREIPWNEKKPCSANLLTTRPRWRPWLRG